MEDRDLLLKDLEHFGESYWRNEAIGEKRVEFFIGVLTAVGGGLVALYTKDEGPPSSFGMVLHGAMAGLLLFGGLTYLRLLQRNRVTDQHLATLRYIRRKLAGADDYRIPVQAKRRWGWLRAGLAETVGTFNGLLAGAWVVLSRGDLWWLGLAVCIVTAAGLWTLARLDRGGSGPEEYFRAGVGAVILNRDGLVLTLERSDAPGSWQLPQGGLDAGEAPEEALFREIKEETGIPSAQLKLQARHETLLAYELPENYRKVKTGRGQVQYWYVLKFEGDSIELPKEGEFRKYQWRPLADLASLARDFRKPVYETLVNWISGRP